MLALSTAALILFHELGARMGVVTGQGLVGLIRDRYGLRVGLAALLALLAREHRHGCAEFAGIAAALELAGVPRAVSASGRCGRDRASSSSAGRSTASSTS